MIITENMAIKNIYSEDRYLHSLSITSIEDVKIYKSWAVVIAFGFILGLFCYFAIIQVQIFFCNKNKEKTIE